MWIKPFQQSIDLITYLKLELARMHDDGRRFTSMPAITINNQPAYLILNHNVEAWWFQMYCHPKFEKNYVILEDYAVNLFLNLYDHIIEAPPSAVISDDVLSLPPLLAPTPPSPPSSCGRRVRFHSSIDTFSPTRQRRRLRSTPTQPPPPLSSDSSTSSSKSSDGEENDLVMGVEYNGNDVIPIDLQELRYSMGEETEFALPNAKQAMRMNVINV